MKFFQFTRFILFGLLVVLSTNRVSACGDGEDSCTSGAKQKPVEKSCCAAEKGVESAGEAAALGHEQADADAHCPCDHENGGCHCPGCATLSHTAPATGLEVQCYLPAITAVPGSVQKMAFYFADHLPEAVYLPIWQPPQRRPLLCA